MTQKEGSGFLINSFLLARINIFKYTKAMRSFGPFIHLPHRSGFTLVELLVVVLIIGVLVAMALPKYQVAVATSRLTTVMNVTRALKESQEFRLMSRGSYIDSLSASGQALPKGCVDQGGGQAVCSNNTKYDVGHMDVLGDVAGFTDINGFLMYYDFPTEHPERAKQKECLALENNQIAASVCEGYGGEKIGTFESWVGTFDRYSMP